jgi:hypothetical protein
MDWPAINKRVARALLISFNSKYGRRTYGLLVRFELNVGAMEWVSSVRRLRVCRPQSATNRPLFPPLFSINRTPPITIPRSTALHMS